MEVGSDETGCKEVLAVVDGYRESEASWLEVIEQLESQGLTIPPKLAIGDGALGFWKALAKKWPQTAQQRCWVHKTANVLNKVPKSVQPKIKAALHEIWMGETRENAYKAFLRQLCEALRGQVPEGHGVPGERQGIAVGVLRFSGGALAAHPDDEPDRIGICHGASEDHEDQELWQ